MQLTGTVNAAAPTAGALVAVLGRPPEIITRGEGHLHHDGHFALAVPDHLDAARDGLASPTALCDGIGVEPPDLLVAVLPVLFVHDGQGNPVRQLIQATGLEALEGTTGHAVLTRWYADRAGTVAGVRPCGHEGRPMTFDLRFQPGWNPVLVEFIADDDERLTSPRTQPALRWHVGPIPAS